MSENLPWPIEDADTAEFWAGARRGELRIQRCVECGRHQFYPRILCTHCGSDAVEWRTMSGGATIYSYTITRRAPHPAFADSVPYAVVLVDLDEGPRMLSRLVDADPESVSIGDRVSVTFREVADGVVLPMFTMPISDEIATT